ncbi:MAG: zinc-ribbon domain-containing protein [Candidatus Heimdallarchaeota archaeon]|nr:zinc-ribbon domain-containing protein [Candidatus Heimdallarchaeota archaeon]
MTKLNEILLVFKTKYLTRSPHLVVDWDDSNKIRPDQLTFGSHERIKWKCKICAYRWETAVLDRTRGNGCPSCSGSVVNDLNRVTNHSSWQILKDEWNYARNIKKPEEYSYGSTEQLWWICQMCNYEWNASLNHRSRGAGCPRCAGLVVNEENCLTNHPRWKELLNGEWDFEVIKLQPQEISFGSNIKINWNCCKCSYKWRSPVKNRTRGEGCPNCAGKVVNEVNCLINHPAWNAQLEKDWDFSKNTVHPSKYSYGSSKKVWWLCKKCEHSWKSHIKRRTRGDGCPSCAGQVVSKKNSLTSHKLWKSKLKYEWDLDKNTCKPSEVSYGSNNKVWWICENCSYSWKAQVKNRIRGSGCQNCRYIRIYGRPLINENQDR